MVSEAWDYDDRLVQFLEGLDLDASGVAKVRRQFTEKGCSKQCRLRMANVAVNVYFDDLFDHIKFTFDEKDRRENELHWYDTIAGFIQEEFEKLDLADAGYITNVIRCADIYARTRTQRVFHLLIYFYQGEISLRKFLSRTDIPFNTSFLRKISILPS